VDIRARRAHRSYPLFKAGRRQIQHFSFERFSKAAAGERSGDRHWRQRPELLDHELNIFGGQAKAPLQLVQFGDVVGRERPVAERYRVSAQSVRKWCRTGKLKAIRVGKLWRISRADLEAFFSRHEQEVQQQLKKLTA
jgi:excisionase family DNA binding protein